MSDRTKIPPAWRVDAPTEPPRRRWRLVVLATALFLGAAAILPRGRIDHDYTPTSSPSIFGLTQLIGFGGGGARIITLKAWGAGGGGALNTGGGGPGGAGGFISGSLTVRPGDTLTITVGGAGTAGSYS